MPKPMWLSEDLNDTLNMFDRGSINEQELEISLEVVVIINEARQEGLQVSPT